jgi:hypothetical protein
LLCTKLGNGPKLLLLRILLFDEIPNFAGLQIQCIVPKICEIQNMALLQL